MDAVAREASSSRAGVADSISGQEAAWKTAGRPGFAKFIDVLEAQAERLGVDLTDLVDKQDHEGGAALDTSVRHD